MYDSTLCIREFESVTKFFGVQTVANLQRGQPDGLVTSNSIKCTSYGKWLQKSLSGIKIEMGWHSECVGKADVDKQTDRICVRNEKVQRYTFVTEIYVGCCLWQL